MDGYPRYMPLMPSRKIDYEEARQLRKEGWKLGEIAGRYGVTRQAVSLALKRRKKKKAKRRKRVPPGSTSRAKINVDEVKRLYKQGWSITGIGEHFDVTTGAISLALSRARVKLIRRRGRPPLVPSPNIRKLVRRYVDDKLTLAQLGSEFHIPYPRLRKLLVKGGAEIRRR